MPALEAMACGVPFIGTKAGAIIEHVGNDEERGLFIEPKFINIDPYGNSNRYYADVVDGYEKLNTVYALNEFAPMGERVVKARKYVEDRTWEITADVMDKAISEVLSVKEIQETVTESKPEQEWATEETK